MDQRSAAHQAPAGTDVSGGPAARPPSRAAVVRGVRILVGLTAGAAAIVFVYAVNRLLTDVPFNQLLRDPNQVAGVSPVVGALTVVGLFGWSAAAVLLMAAGWLRRSARAGDDRATFLLATGSLTLVALADDAYQLHERVLVDLTGVHEYLWYVLYAAVVAVWALVFRGRVRKAPPELFVAAALIAVSQVMDVAPDRLVRWEESLKLLGIGCFVAFAAVEFARTATAIREDRTGQL